MLEKLDLKDITNESASKGKVLVYWLGGAGHILKFDDGFTICVDPYLSDYVERLVGFKRLFRPVIEPSQLHFDTLLISHSHGDHLDADSFSELVKANLNCKIFAAEDCVEFLEKQQAVYTIVTVGTTFADGNVTIEVVPADHGDLSPEAVGFLLSFGARSIYLTGDTCYNKDMLSTIIERKPDIAILCINGAFGNMTSDEAADLVAACESKVAIPTHYGLFAEHGNADPMPFRESVREKSPETRICLLEPGFGVEV
ncbi:MAG: MBL fold metallo-hydrolase [Sedimentisphaerales bacterium]|nr:MBL fold metallo-hydrolase [Sedimentisphaerales bacterium]